MPARQPIDPAWWNADHIDGVAMREALAERDIKTVFNFLHHRGWSWGAIAQATDIGEHGSCTRCQDRRHDRAAAKRWNNDFIAVLHAAGAQSKFQGKTAGGAKKYVLDFERIAD